MVYVLPVIAVFCIGFGTKVPSKAAPDCSTEEGVECYERFMEIANRLRNTWDDEVATEECSALEDVSECMDDYLNTCLTSDERDEIENVMEETQKKCEEEAPPCYVSEGRCYSNVTSIWPYEYHLNRETLDSRCRENPSVRSCLQSVYEKCRATGEINADKLEQIINHTMQADETFCKEGHPEREEYLKHSKCLGDIHEHVEKTCISPSLRYLEALLNRKVKIDDEKEGFLKRDCCNDQLRYLCEAREYQGHCGFDTLVYLLGRRRIQYPESQCDPSWTVESETCQSVLPKTLIHSLLSPVA